MPSTKWKFLLLPLFPMKLAGNKSKGNNLKASNWKHFFFRVLLLRWKMFLLSLKWIQLSLRKKSCLMSCVEVGISLSTSLSLSEIVGGCDVMFNCMDPFAPPFLLGNPMTIARWYRKMRATHASNSVDCVSYSNRMRGVGGPASIVYLPPQWAIWVTLATTIGVPFSSSIPPSIPIHMLM
jgi:hypothetical protein